MSGRPRRGRDGPESPGGRAPGAVLTAGRPWPAAHWGPCLLCTCPQVTAPRSRRAVLWLREAAGQEADTRTWGGQRGRGRRWAEAAGLCVPHRCTRCSRKQGRPPALCVGGPRPAGTRVGDSNATGPGWTSRDAAWPEASPRAAPMFSCQGGTRDRGAGVCGHPACSALHTGASAPGPGAAVTVTPPGILTGASLLLAWSTHRGRSPAAPLRGAGLAPVPGCSSVALTVWPLVPGVQRDPVTA